MLDAGNRTLRVLPDRHSLLAAVRMTSAAKAPWAKSEGPITKKPRIPERSRRARTQKKQPQDASTTLSNPGHVMQSCLPSNPTCHRIPERSRRVRTQEKQPQDASTSSAILDGLSNPGRTQQSWAAQQGCNLICDGTGYTEACFCSASSGQFQSCRTVNNNFFYFFNEM